MTSAHKHDWNCKPGECACNYPGDTAIQVLDRMMNNMTYAMSGRMSDENFAAYRTLHHARWYLCGRYPSAY